jgi:putative radical SAM enzyme (TIGR03279 family)
MKSKIKILHVLKGSKGDVAGIREGDYLVDVNGVVPRDVIEWSTLISANKIKLRLLRDDKPYEKEIHLKKDDVLGILFEEELFDEIMRCENNCIFCFEDQLPVNSRGSLKLRDDDYRLSNIHGNFLSLTNFTGEDFERINQDGISPLYISVHTTNDILRRKMLRNEEAPEILLQLQKLIDMDIILHCQIVLCPGWNDGDELKNTLTDLLKLGRNIESIGVVPVGLSKHRTGCEEIRAITKEDAQVVIKTINLLQQQCRKDCGYGVVYAADEFYLLANMKLPVADDYDDFLQIENGIGMWRAFYDQIDDLPDGFKPEFHKESVVLVTGTLAESLIKHLADRMKKYGKSNISVLPVKNTFLGEGINIAGLMAGNDIVEALGNITMPDKIILPTFCVSQSTGLMIDDMDIDKMQLAIVEKYGKSPEIVLCEEPLMVYNSLVTPEWELELSDEYDGEDD